MQCGLGLEQTNKPTQAKRRKGELQHRERNEETAKANTNTELEISVHP
jgi:hypothetical protein